MKLELHWKIIIGLVLGLLFGVLAATVIAFSTENAEALTATPSPGADELQTAQWRALEKDKAEAAKAKMYEERGAADATRAREREARRAAMEARRLEAKREASDVAAARVLEEATAVGVLEEARGRVDGTSGPTGPDGTARGARPSPRL